MATVELNTLDDEGNVVDTTTMEMSYASISDIIDHAAQFVLVVRQYGYESAEARGVLAEMEEALTVADVIG